MRHTIKVVALLALGGCTTFNSPNFDKVNTPENWSVSADKSIEIVNAPALKNWWMRFNDTTLDALINMSLTQSPDHLIAKAKVEQARGMRKTTRSALFPQVGFSAQTGREDTGTEIYDYPDSFYDGGFDASFELDVFGKNRKNLSASDAQLLSAEEQLNVTNLSLIGEVSRNYIDYRTAQNQLRIAKKNLQSQEKTLDLIEDMFDLGSATKLDVERTLNLVNTTKSSLPNYKRQIENARLRLSVLTGLLPAQLSEILSAEAEIPAANSLPVLLSPATSLALRPDIKVAQADLVASTSLREAAVAEIFPTFSVSGFYGFADNAITSTTQPWNLALGTAVSLLNFGRIEGQIDAAKAREVQAYQAYRKAVLTGVSEVETALNDYTHIRNQYIALENAYKNAQNSLDLSRKLYKEGEVSFLDVLDAQRTLNNAEASMTSVKSEQAQSVIRLYKSLGTY